MLVERTTFSGLERILTCAYTYTVTVWTYPVPSTGNPHARVGLMTSLCFAGVCSFDCALLVDFRRSNLENGFNFIKVLKVTIWKEFLKVHVPT